MVSIQKALYTLTTIFCIESDCMQTQELLQIRKQKGQEIAKTGKVKLNGNKWLVPSQSINRYYDVILRLDKSECNCPDFIERALKCKHIFAVELTVSKSSNRDGSVTVTKTKRITYAQGWSSYNKAQTSELKVIVCKPKNFCK